jgi:hypothetical protein
MSLIIEISETTNTLEVETQIAEDINALEIISSSNDIIQISTEYVGTVVFASDVIGLDTYIADFIDSYEIDCGSP